MKKTIKIFGIIALVAVIGFSFAACGDEDDPDPREDFYGIWKYDNGSYWNIVTLSANKLVLLDDNGDGYTMTNLTWTACTSISGRAGYKITGTVGNITGLGPYKVGTASNGTDGDTVIDAWYISADKQILYWGTWTDLEDDGGDGGDPYNKQ